MFQVSNIRYISVRNSEYITEAEILGHAELGIIKWSVSDPVENLQT